MRATTCRKERQVGAPERGDAHPPQGHRRQLPLQAPKPYLALQAPVTVHSANRRTPQISLELGPFHFFPFFRPQLCCFFFNGNDPYHFFEASRSFQPVLGRFLEPSNRFLGFLDGFLLGFFLSFSFSFSISLLFFKCTNLYQMYEYIQIHELFQIYDFLPKSMIFFQIRDFFLQNRSIMAG